MTHAQSWMKKVSFPCDDGIAQWVGGYVCVCVRACVRAYVCMYQYVCMCYTVQHSHIECSETFINTVTGNFYFVDFVCRCNFVLF